MTTEFLILSAYDFVSVTHSNYNAYNEFNSPGLKPVTIISSGEIDLLVDHNIVSASSQ